MSIATLTQFERGAIFQLLSLGFGNNQIALKLSVSKLTISSKLHRVTLSWHTKTLTPSGVIVVENQF